MLSAVSFRFQNALAVCIGRHLGFARHPRCITQNFYLGTFKKEQTCPSNSLLVPASAGVFKTQSWFFLLFSFLPSLHICLAITHPLARLITHLVKPISVETFCHYNSRTAAPRFSIILASWIASATSLALLSIGHRLSSSRRPSLGYVSHSRFFDSST
jgi:hypothetical protein